MDMLTLCWTFDNRWVFGMNSKLYYIWVTVIIDVLTILGLGLQKQSPSCKTSANQMIILLMVVGHLSVMAISYVKTAEERQKNYANKEEIVNFMKRYHIKKTIWSVVGLFIATMSFILLLLECCQALAKPHDAYVIYIRIMIDIGCWAYLALMIIIFISCKVWYLIWAWKFPQSYLRFRHVIR